MRLNGSPRPAADASSSTLVAFPIGTSNRLVTAADDFTESTGCARRSRDRHRHHDLRREHATRGPSLAVGWRTSPRSWPAIDRPELALALDTGHAHIAADVATETDRGRPMAEPSTHVHDNDGRRDSSPAARSWGRSTGPKWLESLDAINYRGPIVLECIRHLREVPSSLNDDLLVLLRRLTRTDRSLTASQTRSKASFDPSAPDPMRKE